MPRGQTDHLKDKQFKSEGDIPKAKSPLTVRVNAEVDAFIRSQPDRNKWLQQVIEEAAMACIRDTMAV